MQATDVLSYSNTLKEIMFGVQSMPFFKDYTTFDQLGQHIGEGDDLFKMSENGEFVALSKLVEYYGEDRNTSVYASKSTFPVSGYVGVIYVDLQMQKCYRW